MNFPLGSFVVNFGTTAMVVGHFTAASGQASEHDGHPILREVTADRRHFVGDKWLADPAECRILGAEYEQGGR